MSEAAITLSKQLSDELDAFSQGVTQAAQHLQNAQTHLKDLTDQVNLVLDSRLNPRGRSVSKKLSTTHK